MPLGIGIGIGRMPASQEARTVKNASVRDGRSLMVKSSKKGRYGRILLSVPLPIARSSLPSRSQSPAATVKASGPTVMVAGAPKPPAPSPSSTLRGPRVLTTARSSLPPLFQPPVAKLRGDGAVASLTGAPKAGLLR